MTAALNALLNLVAPNRCWFNMDTFTLLCIDPGNNVGVAIYTVNAKTLEIISLHTRLFILDNHIGNTTIDRMPKKLLLLDKIVNELSEKYDPLVIGFELAFLNMRFPKAVMQLSQYTGIIEHMFRKSNPFIKFFRYPPKSIKLAIGGGGGANKFGMTEAVKKIPELYRHVLPDYLTEHEVDAVAIGYTTLCDIRKYPYLLYAVG